VRSIIGQLLDEKFHTYTPWHVLWQIRQIIRRREVARFYHWKKRKRLPPLKKQLNIFDSVHQFLIRIFNKDEYLRYFQCKPSSNPW